MIFHQRVSEVLVPGVPYIALRPSIMGSELRSQNFDLAKFQEIIPRTTSYGAFLLLELGFRILKKNESAAKLKLG